jgi:hypothetical protein
VTRDEPEGSHGPGPAQPATRVERLAGHLLEGSPDDALAEDLVAWLTGSPRFRTFADANRDKIRKKLRGAAADPEGRLDLRAELRVAHLLLADRRLELAFEAYGSGRAGPDFTVALRGAPRFNVEVTRMRHVPRAPTDGGPATGLGGPLLAKLRQLPPSVPNAVVVAIDPEGAAIDVGAATQALRTLADRKDEAFFARHGLDGSRGFYERYLRLGAVVVWGEGAPDEARAGLWINRSARIPLPARAGSALLACLRDE